MSTVVLQSIEWGKLFSFGDNNHVTLDSEPVTQIVAPNGFGKSSIPLILEEALYNKNSKGIKKADIPNRALDGKYSIRVGFSINNKEYELTINRASTIKVILIEDGEDISSHTATGTFKQIEDLMGLDFKTFQQLVYQSTNSSLQFLTATDTARKKFLIDLFDLSEYTQLFEIFKEASKSLSADVNKFQGQIDTINKWLANNIVSTTDRMAITPIPDKPDFGTQIAGLTSQLSNISQSNLSIERNNKNKKLLETIDIEQLRNVNLTTEDYGELDRELGSARANQNNALAIITKLEKLEDQCPTCLQEIDSNFYQNLLSSNKQIANEEELTISSIVTRINDIKARNRLINETKSKIEEWEKLNSLVDNSLPSDKLDASDIEQELSGIRKILEEAERDISKARKANDEAIRFNSKIDTYLEQNEEFNKQLIEAKANLDGLSDKYKNLEVLKKAFSTNGLIAYELENRVKDLEEFTNIYLSELSDGRFTIEFAISNDKLNVILTDNGKEISILAPSSGEMARINISTLLAIRKLMADISKNKINVLFLDEVISVLDDQGREKLVEVLLKEEELNTFLVSHSWTHPLVDKLIIRKEDEISWIEHG